MEMTRNEFEQQVKEQLNVLTTYKEVTELETCNLLHIYDTGKLCLEEDGYYDSRYFNLWAFNTKLMQKINLGRHDGCTFKNNAVVDIVRVFLDGSTLIRFKNTVKIGFGSDIDFYEE